MLCEKNLKKFGMLKYIDTMVTFSEFPDEISLCINISNCPCHCAGCHSSYLAEDIGEPLLESTLHKLITENKGITCVGFMGGDSDPKEVNKLAKWVRENYPKLHIGWYSGRQTLADEVIDLGNFDYLKLGPYIKQFGPLNNPNTNQKFYKIDRKTHIMTWCTNIFWKEAE